jgi:hypothetical protein
MSLYFYLSSVLAVVAALVHSYLGEVLLFRPLAGESEHFGVMKSRTLRRVSRAVWHLPSICWVLMSAMTLVLLQQPVQVTPLYFAGAVYFFSGAGNLVATRGKSPGWVVLWLAAGFLWMAIRVQ